MDVGIEFLTGHFVDLPEDRRMAARNDESQKFREISSDFMDGFSIRIRFNHVNGIAVFLLTEVNSV